jgi:hypothetical protein
MRRKSVLLAPVGTALVALSLQGCGSFADRLAKEIADVVVAEALEPALQKTFGEVGNSLASIGALQNALRDYFDDRGRWPRTLEEFTEFNENQVAPVDMSVFESVLMKEEPDGGLHVTYEMKRIEWSDEVRDPDDESSVLKQSSGSVSSQGTFSIPRPRSGRGASDR